MQNPYEIISNNFPVTVLTADGIAAKYLALYLVAAKIPFSADSVQKASSRFRISISSIDKKLDRFLNTPLLARPATADSRLFPIGTGVLVGIETEFMVTVSGTNSDIQTAAFIADAWQLICQNSPTNPLQ